MDATKELAIWQKRRDKVSYAYHLLIQVKEGKISLDAQMAFLEKRDRELLDELQILINESKDTDDHD